MVTSGVLVEFVVILHEFFGIALDLLNQLARFRRLDQRSEFGKFLFHLGDAIAKLLVVLLHSSLILHEGSGDDTPLGGDQGRFNAVHVCRQIYLSSVYSNDLIQL